MGSSSQSSSRYQPLHVDGEQNRSSRLFVYSSPMMTRKFESWMLQCRPRKRLRSEGLASARSHVRGMDRCRFTNPLLEDIVGKGGQNEKSRLLRSPGVSSTAVVLFLESQYQRKLSSLSTICSRSFNDDDCTLGF